MAFDAGSVIAKIKADLTDFQSGIKKVQTEASGMADRVKSGVGNMNDKIKEMTPNLRKGALALGAVAAAGTVMLNDWKSAAMGAEVEMARFDATLKATGKSTDAVRESILKAADAAVQLGFDDEEAANVLANFFQRTNDVTQATNLNNTAMDLARKKNIGLSEAANLVTQVLSGNGRVLKQYGIDIKESASPLEALAQLQDVVAGQSTAYMETAAGKSERLGIVIANLKENLGAALLPIMVKVTDALSALITWIDNLSPSVKNMIAYVVLAVTAFAAIAAPILAFITLIPLITAGLGAIATALAFIVSPIGLVIAAVGLLALAYNTNFLGIRDFLQPWVAWFVALFQEINAIVEEHGGWIMLIPTAWGIVVEQVTAFFEVLKLNIMAWITIITLSWKTFWQNINNFFNEISITIQLGVKAMWDGIKGLFDSGIALLTTAWSGFMNGIKSLASNIWEGIKNTFKEGVNSLISILNGIINSYNRVIGSVAGKGAKGLQIGNIPSLAEGGIVPATPGGMLVRVGEGGEDEVVTPLSKMNSGMHFHFHDSIISSADAAREIMDEAMRTMRPNLGL